MIIPPFLPTTSFPTQQGPTAGLAGLGPDHGHCNQQDREGSTPLHYYDVTELITIAIILHKLICWNSSWPAVHQLTVVLCAGR